MSTGDIVVWIFLGLILFGGAITGFFRRIAKLIELWITGRSSQSKSTTTTKVVLPDILRFGEYPQWRLMYSFSEFGSDEVQVKTEDIFSPIEPSDERQRIALLQCKYPELTILTAELQGSRKLTESRLYELNQLTPVDTTQSETKRKPT